VKATGAIPKAANEARALQVPPHCIQNACWISDLAVLTFPLHPKHPQLGRIETLAQQSAQHKMSFSSSMASSFPIVTEVAL
jgi:hypothetical protein